MGGFVNVIADILPQMITLYGQQGPLNTVPCSLLRSQFLASLELPWHISYCLVKT